uniref:fibroblast growth factor 7-like n=1 Tax=Oncorhynchus gorbuscha TaxID=8017 RepID=UPI001EAEA977|nr:fibroblast growth factor 7-like [Oncorhynchus gorbuscha]
MKLWFSNGHPEKRQEGLPGYIQCSLYLFEQCIYICPLSPIGILEVRTVSEGGVLAIKGVKSQYYISMNRTGLLQGKKIYNENCNFKEIFLENYFNAYSSVKSSRDGKEMFIALSQKGRPLRGKKTRREHIASHFIPMKCREEERTGV